MICTRTLVAQHQKHHACKSENKYCGLLSVWHGLFPPISKYFDSQGMAASRAAHIPHIVRASRQMTAALRHNAACRRIFCALDHVAILLNFSGVTDHVDLLLNFSGVAIISMIDVIDLCLWITHWERYMARHKCCVITIIIRLQTCDIGGSWRSSFIMAATLSKSDAAQHTTSFTILSSVLL